MVWPLYAMQYLLWVRLDTLTGPSAMSTLPLSSDIVSLVRHVRKVPLADVDCARVVLFFLRTLFARPVLDDLNDA